MPNAPIVNIVDQDFSFQNLGALVGISGFIGTFERGPIGVLSGVITSSDELRKKYGGYVTGNDDYLLASRILDRGGKLRILNVRHYTDVSDPATLTAVKAGKQNIKVTQGGSDVNIAELTPKYAGLNYNNLKVVVKAPSNGLASQGFFDLTMYIAGAETYTTENYPNLHIEGKPTALNAKWLDEVRKRSDLVDVNYLDTSAITNPTLQPKQETLSFSGGTNGGAVVATDFIGAKAGKTGFYALDGFNDMYDFAAPNVSDVSVHIAGANYAEQRQDIEYLGHLDYSGGVAGLIAARASVTVNSKYYSLFSGGIEIVHPLTGETVIISEVADVMGIGIYVANKFGPWVAMNNYVKGFVPNATGVGLNLGYDDLNLLANRQINMMVLSDNEQSVKVVHLNGNFSGQSAFSKNSWRNIVRLLIYFKKSVKPGIHKYISEPNEFTTWKLIYNENKPFMQSLESNRAVYKDGWAWQGDQYATRLQDLQINNIDDVNAGKYLIKVSLNPITAINEITIYLAVNSVTGTLEIMDPDLT